MKVHGSALDTSPRNQPHVGCSFYVDFYGFDADQHANVTLTGQAPTGPGTKLFSDQNALINPNSSRGQGNTWDSEMAFTTEQDSPGYYIDVTKLGAPAHQGYHIRLTVDALGAPGGSKTKVFWVQPCTGAGAGGGGLGAGGGGLGAGGGGLGAGGGSKSGGGAIAGNSAGLPGSGGITTGKGTSESLEAAPAGAGTAVLGEQFTRASSATSPGAGAIGTQVLGESFSAGNSLPFTGADIAGMTLAGLGAIGAGTAAAIAFRRRSHPIES